MLILPLLPILCVFEKLDYQGRQTHKILEFQGGHIFGQAISQNLSLITNPREQYKKDRDFFPWKGT